MTTFLIALGAAAVASAATWRLCKASQKINIEELAEGIRQGLAARSVTAIEKLLPGDCDHSNNRHSCWQCAERRTVEAALDVVRETGGVTP